MSIYNKVDDIIDECLRLKHIGTKSPHYGNKKSCQEINRKSKNDFDIGLMLKKIFNQIEKNYETFSRDPNDFSKENWRWEKKPKISPNNRNPETVLEKAIVNATGNDWTNQIPVASGLTSSTSQKHAAIDMAREISDKEYEFFELKVTSDTPLKAAMQLMRYGLLYLFIRREGIDSHQDLMQANKIQLSVLAPNDYYYHYKLHWLESAISEGLSGLLEEHNIDGINDINFNFKVFPKGFISCKGGKFKEEEIKDALEKIKCRY